MDGFTEEPIINIIHNGIKRDIRVAIENKCYRASIILIYSGIEAMAFLDMPKKQKKTERKNFILWANTYIKFPKDSPINGEDLYSARCGIVHSYSIYSRDSHKPYRKLIAYIEHCIPDIRYNPDHDQKLVVVSIQWLVQAFFDGIDSFLVHVFTQPQKAKIVENRLKSLFSIYPVDGGGK